MKACCDIELVDALTVNDFDGMGVIMADKDVNKMLLRPIRVNQDRIDDYADDCMRILFDTWRTKNFFPPCPYLADKYLASEDLMLVPKCIPRILQQRSQEGTGRTCEICGQMLPYVTQNDINNYTRHQMTRYRVIWCRV